MTSDKTSGLLIGVETGGTKVKLAAAYTPSEILSEQSFATTTPDLTISRIHDFIRQVQSEFNSEIAAIGAASFGPVCIDRASSEYGKIQNTPKRGWSGTDLVAAFSDLQVPVIVDTDVNGAALAEWYFGAGKDQRRLAYVTVGTGIGVGVLHDGVPQSGISHFEIGHILPRRASGDTYAGCCPFHGDCLEGLASGPAILGRWGFELSDPDCPADALDMQGNYLAQLMATIVLNHMPDRIVVGGGVMKTTGLIETVRRQTEARLAGYITSDQLENGLSEYITLPGLGDEAGVIGALLMAQNAKHL